MGFCLSVQVPTYRRFNTRAPFSPGWQLHSVVAMVRCHQSFHTWHTAHHPYQPLFSCFWPMRHFFLRFFLSDGDGVMCASFVRNISAEYNSAALSFNRNWCHFYFPVWIVIVPTACFVETVIIFQNSNLKIISISVTIIVQNPTSTTTCTILSVSTVMAIIWTINQQDMTPNFQLCWVISATHAARNGFPVMGLAMFTIQVLFMQACLKPNDILCSVVTALVLELPIPTIPIQPHLPWTKVSLIHALCSITTLQMLQ